MDETLYESFRDGTMTEQLLRAAPGEEVLSVRDRASAERLYELWHACDAELHRRVFELWRGFMPWRSWVHKESEAPRRRFAKCPCRDCRAHAKLHGWTIQPITPS